MLTMLSIFKCAFSLAVPSLLADIFRAGGGAELGERQNKKIFGENVVLRICWLHLVQIIAAILRQYCSFLDRTGYVFDIRKRPKRDPSNKSHV